MAAWMVGYSPGTWSVVASVAVARIDETARQKQSLKENGMGNPPPMRESEARLICLSRCPRSRNRLPAGTLPGKSLLPVGALDGCGATIDEVERRMALGVRHSSL